MLVAPIKSPDEADAARGLLVDLGLAPSESLAPLEDWPGPREGGAVAMEDDEVIGAAVYLRIRRDAPLTVAPEVVIGVRPTHRNRGIGDELHRVMEEEARRHDHPLLAAAIREDNETALRLATRRGYLEVARGRGVVTLLLPLDSDFSLPVPRQHR